LAIGFEVGNEVRENHGMGGRQTQYRPDNTDFVMLGNMEKALEKVMFDWKRCLTC
jgi:hypothetical protein